MFSSRCLWGLCVLVWTLLVAAVPLRAQAVAYIYGDVADDGTIPSGAAAPFHQMLLTDTGNRGCSMFKAMVEGEGYTISQHYDQATTLNATFLDQFEVVVFGLHQKLWSATEKGALDIWLRAGGGILLYSDSAAGGLHSIVGIKNTTGQAAVNNLLTQYGMQVTVDQGGGVRAYTSISDESNPVTAGSLEFEGEGVSPVACDESAGVQVLYPFESAFQISGSALTIDARNVTIPSPRWAAVALQEVEAGRIIALFDRQPIWNNGEGSSIQKRDNEEVLRRIINHLVEDLVPSDPGSLASLKAETRINLSDGLEYLELSYRQWSGGSGIPGVDYAANGYLFRVETNQDLATPGLWSAGPHLVEEVNPAVDHGDGTETVTLRVFPRPDQTPRSFARLALYPSNASVLVAEAGDDDLIGESGSALLEGAVAGSGVTAITWSKRSGPGTVTFGDPALAATSASFSLPGTYQLLLSASTSTTAVSDLVEVRVVSNTQVVRSINCGGGVYAGANGFTYEADTLFTGGHIDSFPGNPVAGTADDALYNTARSSHSAYTIPVPDGDYLVLLQFSETFFTAVNKRIFDTSIEGVLVLDDLDLVATAPGKWVAYDRVLETSVSGGTLDLTFSASINNALLNALVVISE